MLLGESHDSHEHHRWQLQVLTALHARHPDLVIALEMFPRRVQPALDRWVAGEIDEAEFLRASRVAPGLEIRPGAVPADLPLRADEPDPAGRDQRGPIADPGGVRGGLCCDPGERARRHRRAGTGDRSVRGHAARELAGSPAAGQAAGRVHSRGRMRSSGASSSRNSSGTAPWRRVSPTPRARSRGPIVVGLMGSGHVIHDWGVPHQLQQMGRQGAADAAAVGPRSRLRGTGRRHRRRRVRRCRATPRGLPVPGRGSASRSSPRRMVCASERSPPDRSPSDGTAQGRPDHRDRRRASGAGDRSRCRRRAPGTRHLVAAQGPARFAHARVHCEVPAGEKNRDAARADVRPAARLAGRAGRECRA